MKTKLFVLSALSLATVSFLACTSDNLEPESDLTVQETTEGIPFTITVGAEDTKTTNDGLSTNWFAGDMINVFHAVNGADPYTYVSDDAFTAGAAGPSVSFSGTVSETLVDGTKYDWYALYPYGNPYMQTPASFSYVTIGSTSGQTQVGNNSTAHLAGASMPMYGKLTEQDYDADLSFSMKHMASIARVNVTNGISGDITVQKVSIYAGGNNLVGQFIVDFSGTSPVLTNSTTSTTATLDVTSGSAIANGDQASFYIAIAPVTVAAGSKVTIDVQTDQGTQSLTSPALKSDFVFRPGKIHDLNFTFTNKTVTQAEFKYNDADWLEDQSITLPSSGAGTNISALTQTVGEISLTSTDGSIKTRVWNSGGVYDLRAYNGGSIKLSSTDGYIINKIVFNGSKLTVANVSASTGTYTPSDEAPTWKGFAQDVVFSFSATVNINTITVFYQAATASDHILSMPVKDFDAAYDATSTVVGIRTLNISDMVVSSTSPGYDSYTATSSAITVNYSANAGYSPRDIVVNVSSASAGFDEDITITQAGAPATVNTVVEGNLGTVTAQISSFSTKGFTISDATGSIFVYTNANNSSTYSIGQTVTVSGTVGSYNKGLQFPTSSTITAGATGSYVYPTPVSFIKSEIDTYLGDGSNRFATYVTLTGVVKKNGSNYDIIVGGGSTANVTMYYPLSSMTTGLAEGDNITVTGYAMSILSSKCGIIPTSVVNNETTPKITFTDITGVAAAGVTDATLTVTPFRIAGWTPTVTCTGCVTASSINTACTTVTYTVSANSTSEEKTGTIVVTFEDGVGGEVEYTINVTQQGKVSGTDVTVSIADYATANSWVNGTKYTSLTIDSEVTATVAGGSNTGKYYTSGNEWRLYQTESASITINAGTHTITSVVITYNVDKTGVLKDKENNTVSSGSSYAVGAESVAFSVGNSGSATNGQVKITSIRVIYE